MAERPRGSVSCSLPGSCSVWPVMTLYCSKYGKGGTGGGGGMGGGVTPCVRLEWCCDLSLLCTPCTTITAPCCHTGAILWPRGITVMRMK